MTLNLTQQGPFTPPPMDRGDRLPDLVLPGADGRQEGLFTMLGGRPAAMLLLRDPTDQVSKALMKLLPALADTTPKPDLLVITAAPVDADTRAAFGGGIRFLTDPQGSFAGLLNLPYDQGVVVTDPDVRVLMVERRPDSRFVDAVKACLSEDLPAMPEAANPQVSPFLLIRNVLTRGECRELIDLWERGGNEESGSYVRQGGETKIVYDHAIKRRRDHHIVDPAVVERVSHVVGRRVIPEIGKAFCFEATRFEEFKVVRYDAADGGHFSAHRDNVTPANAHRRFAMSLILNAEEFEGGGLQFAEYGPALYYPPTGAAAVFSCSHLHEAMPVTKGHRFVLLAFLFGEAEARQLAQAGRA